MTDKKLTLQEAEEKMLSLKKEVGKTREHIDNLGKELNQVMLDTYDVQEGQMTVEKMIRLIRRTVNLELYEKGIIKEDPRDTVKTTNEKPKEDAAKE